MHEIQNKLTRDHLLGVLEVLEHGLLAPGNTGVGVGSGVSIASTSAGLAAHDTSEVGALLALTVSSDNSVALEAELLEEGSTLQVGKKVMQECAWKRKNET